MATAPSHLKWLPSGLMHLLGRFMLPVWTLFIAIQNSCSTFESYLFMQTHMLIGNATQVDGVMHATSKGATQVDGVLQATIWLFPKHEHERLMADLLNDFLHRDHAGSLDQMLGRVKVPLDHYFGLSRHAFTWAFMPAAILTACLLGVALTSFFRHCGFFSSFGSLHYLEVTVRIKENRAWKMCVNAMLIFSGINFVLFWHQALDHSTDRLQDSQNFLSRFFFSFLTICISLYALLFPDPIVHHWLTTICEAEDDEAQVLKAKAKEVVFERGWLHFALQSNASFMHILVNALWRAHANENTNQNTQLAKLLRHERVPETMALLVELQKREFHVMIEGSSAPLLESVMIGGSAAPLLASE